MAGAFCITPVCSATSTLVLCKQALHSACLATPFVRRDKPEKQAAMWWDDNREDLNQPDQGTLPTWDMLRRIHPYVRPHLAWFALAFLLALLGVGLILMQPVIFKHIIDVDFPKGDLNSLMRSALGYLGLLAGGAIATGTATVILGRRGVEVVNHIKQDLFDRILDLGISWVEKHQTGTLVSRVESDSQRLVSLTSTMAMRMLSAMVMIVGAIVIIGSVDIRLFWIAGTFLPLMLAGTVLLFAKLRPRFRQERRYYARISGQVAELVPAARLLQALGRKAWAHERLAGENRFYKQFTLRLMLREYGFWNGMGYVQIAMTCVALFLGAGWIADGSLSVGSLVMFAQYAAMIYWPVIELSEQLAEIQRAGGAADRIFTLLEEAPTVLQPQHPAPLPNTIESLDFDNITFGYTPDEPVLRSFNLKVKAGQTIAIVGPTGGGKSTILGLSTRLRDPQSGSIRLNGRDIREYELKGYRRLFGLVLQDLFLFPDSIEANLRAFRDDVTPQQVQEAARVAGIEEEVLKRAGGFDGQLAERGADLSYGQRQLLALARALAVDPAILVLDEATSSVDPRTERNIQRTLDRLTQSRTTLVVAHRLSTVRHADSIIVLEKGQVVEQGRHDELLARNGAYARLLKRQQESGEIVDDSSVPANGEVGQ
jgi:ATP-binding cassette subfamily B multidrug efflux pump